MVVDWSVAFCDTGLYRVQVLRSEQECTNGICYPRVVVGAGHVQSQDPGWSGSCRMGTAPMVTCPTKPIGCMRKNSWQNAHRIRRFCVPPSLRPDEWVLRHDHGVVSRYLKSPVMQPEPYLPSFGATVNSAYTSRIVALPA